jgi:transglutaminase-like putative cysteine protease
VLSLNLPRRLAARGLAAGQRLEVSLFDPATLRNAPMELHVQAREIVTAAGRPVPAFRVESRFNGISGRSWITDVGEVVREESPTGLLVVRESAERAQSLAISGAVQSDLLEAAAIVPEGGRRLDEPTAVRRLRLRVTALEGLDPRDLDGGAQRRLPDGDLELVDPRSLAASARDPEAERYLAPEPFLESDDPEVVAEARRAAGDAATDPLRAERLVRHVHTLLEKKPTVSLPSAREVLKTRVGDCNEHTALYVAMARALGLPARIAVGLVALHGAFYYHAWPEVYVAEADGARGRWLPVDPTLNQFPADATHLRLARGGLDRQAAILGLIGRARLRIVDLDLQPGAVPVLVGRADGAARPPLIGLPAGGSRHRGCWAWLRELPLFR